MNAKIDGNNLTIDIEELLNSLGDDQIAALAMRIACCEAVITHVIDQVLDGCTEDGSYAPTACTVQHNELHMGALDLAVRRVAKGANDKAKEEIGRLEGRVKELVSRIYEHNTKCHDRWASDWMVSAG